MDWQPIDTAPKDGTRIMLGNAETEDRGAHSTIGWWQEAEADGVDFMGADAGFTDFEFSFYRPGRSFGPIPRQYCECQPTHWAPIPAPPTDKT